MTNKNGYWSDGYWIDNYWAEYFALGYSPIDPCPAGYFPVGYWTTGYWVPNYWTIGYCVTDTPTLEIEDGYHEHTTTEVPFSIGRKRRGKKLLHPLPVPHYYLHIYNSYIRTTSNDFELTFVNVPKLKRIKEETELICSLIEIGVL